MTDEIRCNLLRSRKHYKRSEEVSELLQKLDDTYIEDVCFFESEIKKQEELLYQLLHKRIQLDSKLESLVRRNATFSSEYLECDYDYEKTCKALETRFVEYKLLVQSLDVAVKVAKGGI